MIFTDCNKGKKKMKNKISTGDCERYFPIGKE
jgi:hypothetical protein